MNLYKILDLFPTKRLIYREREFGAVVSSVLIRTRSSRYIHAHLFICSIIVYSKVVKIDDSGQFKIGIQLFDLITIRFVCLTGHGLYI